MVRVISIAAVLFAWLVGQPVAPPAQVQPTEYDHVAHLPLIVTLQAHHPYVDAVIERTNYFRQQHGCPPVTPDDRLHEAAQRHSDDMAEKDFVDHTGSDGSSPWDRMRDAGYEWIGAAENIAAGPPTPERMLEALMNSEDHRENILNCALEDIGVGYRYLPNDAGSENYYHYWTQVFGIPQ